jgi:hypothetical protein
LQTAVWLPAETLTGTELQAKAFLKNNFLSAVFTPNNSRCSLFYHLHYGKGKKQRKRGD